MSDFDTLLDDLAGALEWETCHAPPGEEGPVFWRDWSELRPELTEPQRERWRALRAGSPQVEAQAERTLRYGLVWLELMAGWTYDRNTQRLRAVDRAGYPFGPSHYAPRIVVDDAEKPLPLAAESSPALSGGSAGAKKTKKRRAPLGAAMVAWLDALPPRQPQKTPNALADQYVDEDPGRREKQHRHACTVFAKPDEYRGRV